MKTFARRLALLALAVPLLFSVAVRAQELTQADKEKALQLLETSKKMVLDATKDLSPAQWNFKPAPDRGSVAECMNEMGCLRIHLSRRRAQRTPHQANSRSQSRSQLPQILITASGRWAALRGGRLMRRGVPG